MTDPERPATAPARLRLRFAAAVALGALGLAALWRPLGATWVLAATVPGAYLAAYAGTNLDANRPPDGGDARPRLGAANAVTLFRGWLAVVLAGVEEMAFLELGGQQAGGLEGRAPVAQRGPWWHRYWMLVFLKL